jgi:competence protein ComEC
VKGTGLAGTGTVVTAGRRLGAATKFTGAGPGVSAGLALLLTCFGSGILLAVFSQVPVRWWQGALLLLAALAGLAGWRYRSTALVLAALVVLAGTAGLILGARAWHETDSLNSLQGKLVILTGTVAVGTVQQRPEGVTLELEVEELRSGIGAEAAGVPVPGKVRLFVKQLREAWPGQQLQGRLQVKGELTSLAGMANPGTRDSELAGRLQGLGGRLTVGRDQWRNLPGGLSVLSRFQRGVNYVRQQALQYLPHREGALLLSMTLGGYRDLDEEAAAIFRGNGLAHLLAVSGTHVAFLTALALGLTSSWPKTQQKIFIGALNLVYAVACGLAPAVLRAVACSLVLLAGATPQRRAHRGRLLAGVALVLLAYKPLWLLDVSFQLSFVTVAGLIWVLPQLLLYLPQRVPAAIRELAAVTLTAQLVSLPLVIWYFHQFSLVALLSNILLLPALAAALACFLPGLLLVALVPGLACLCFVPALFLTRGALAAGQLLLQLPGAVQTCGHWGYLRTAAYYLLLFSWLTPGWWGHLSIRSQRQLLAVSLSIFVGLGCWQLLKPLPLTVYHLDVGQGDAALLVTPDRQYYLIDAGGLSGAYDVGARVVVPVLRYLGVSRLDGLFISHGDHDHAGGAAAVAANLPVRRIFRGAAAPSEDEQKLLQVLTPATSLETLTAGQQLQLGSTLVEVITAGQGAVTANESSLILRFNCGGRQLLFTGDATGEEELAATAAGVEAQLLKVSHHGAASSSEAGFLQRVRPRLAVISVGRHNLYGHPAPDAVGRLLASGAQVLRTDVLGAIKVVFDGSALKWYSYRYQPASF